MNLLLFELNGTLVKPSTFDQDLLLKSMRAFLNKRVKIDFEELSDLSESELFTLVCQKALKRPPTKREILEFDQLYFEVYKTHFEKAVGGIEAMGGAYELLDQLRESNQWTFAIASTQFSKISSFKLRAAGFYTKNLTLSSATDALRKSDILHSAQIKAAQKKRIQSFQQVTFVGDPTTSQNLCMELQMPFIAVESNENNKEEFLTEFPSKSQFLRLVQKAGVPNERKRSFNPLFR